MPDGDEIDDVKEASVSEIKPCCLSSSLNRIVSFIIINSVSLKTKDKNLNACYVRFLTLPWKQRSINCFTIHLTFVKE
jgi:hypothetical protein